MESHRQLLEADLEPARGTASSCSWSTPRHLKAGARPQDRRHGRRVDRGPVPPRPAPGRASSRPVPSASCASSSATGRRLVRERASEINRLAKVLEGRQHQARLGEHQHRGVSGRAILAALAEGTDRSDRRSPSLPGAPAPQARHARRGAGGIGRAAPAVPAYDPTSPSRRPRRAHRVARRRDRRAPSGCRRADRAARHDPGHRAPHRRGARCEIGTDMARFGSARRLASWAGMCPGNYESAGTRHGGRTRRGSPWLRSALVGSARSASRTDDLPRRPIPPARRRRGAKRACVAVGHTILGIIYAVLVTRPALPRPRRHATSTTGTASASGAGSPVASSSSAMRSRFGPTPHELGRVIRAGSSVTMPASRRPYVSGRFLAVRLVIGRVGLTRGLDTLLLES